MADTLSALSADEKKRQNVNRSYKKSKTIGVEAE